MTRALLFAHRWLGVALCVLFLIWFPSGIGMMYWGYPEITERDRVARGADLDPASIRVSPTDVFAFLGLSGQPSDIRITSYDGRPVYRFTDAVGENVVYADTGDPLDEVTPALMLRVAAAWARQPAADAQVTRLADVDQWTLQIPFRQLQPLAKYSWPSGDDVYVSSVTGEVVQHTTRGSRLGAWLGPIPHWLYVTPLRKHGPEWSRLVIWTSGAGTVTAIIGVLLGAWFYLPKRRVPYTGQKRWHMVLGLIFGLATITWAFSGMLSMDPFPSLSGAAPARNAVAAAIPRALRPRPVMSSFFAKDPAAALAEVSSLHVRELLMGEIANEPVYVATLADGSTRVIPVRGTVRDEFDRAALVATINKVAAPGGGAEIVELDAYDAYYLDRRGQLPLPVLRVQLRDAEETRYYIDPKTARVVGSYSAERWVSRWLYRGLHSLNFPWLYQSRPLWDIVVIAFMVGGTALCVTSLVLAWRVLGRKLALRAARA